MIWHSTSTADILAELEVDDKKGLPNGVADMRLQINGKNVQGGKQLFAVTYNRNCCNECGSQRLSASRL